jgi:predicted XRE-type DNA-binding protein
MKIDTELRHVTKPGANLFLELGFAPAEAAGILMVSRPRVPDVVNKKTAKFTIDTLVEMLSRIGKPVKLAIS